MGKSIFNHDCGPDFTANACFKLSKVDAILFTHEHADPTGIDDSTV
jgi:phosphoribosyl 1,2-cyclic phosphodiesterase